MKEKGRLEREISQLEAFEETMKGIKKKKGNMWYRWKEDRRKLMNFIKIKIEKDRCQEMDGKEERKYYRTRRKK